MAQKSARYGYNPLSHDALMNEMRENFEFRKNGGTKRHSKPDSPSKWHLNHIRRKKKRSVPSYRWRDEDSSSCDPAEALWKNKMTMMNMEKKIEDLDRQLQKVQCMPY